MASLDQENGKVTVLSAQQQNVIDFYAVGGLITEGDGSFKKMKLHEFADQLGITRQTIANWRNAIPDFWELVKKRRLELGSQTRLATVHNGLYLKAAAGVPEAVKLYLQIFDGWQPPSQAVQVDAGGGLADLLNIVRQKQLQQPDRKVIDANTTDNQ